MFQFSNSHLIDGAEPPVCLQLFHWAGLVWLVSNLSRLPRSGKLCWTLTFILSNLITEEDLKNYLCMQCQFEIAEPSHCSSVLKSLLPDVYDQTAMKFPQVACKVIHRLPSMDSRNPDWRADRYYTLPKGGLNASGGKESPIFLNIWNHDTTPI